MTARRSLASRKPAALVAAAFVCALWTRPASADAGPKIHDSVWTPLGVNVGYSVNPEFYPNGFLGGVEASLVYLDRSALWVGGYGDALRDFGANQTRVSVGAEVGMAVFGLDLGYVRSFSDDGDRSGFRGRLMLSLAAVHLYGGVGHMLGDGAYTYGEMGLLLKIPIPIWEGERDDPRFHRRISD